MANLGTGGDCRNVTEEDMESKGGWKVMPAGWYRFMVSESDYKQTSSRDGMCLHLKLRCLDPAHQGEEKRDFLTLEHPNSQTVQIARAKLKSLAIACGHPNPDMVDDSAQLHQIPIMVRLGVERSNDPKYGDVDGNQNRVWEYMNVALWQQKHGNGPAPAARPAPPPNAPPPIDEDSVPF